MEFTITVHEIDVTGRITHYEPEERAYFDDPGSPEYMEFELDECTDYCLMWDYSKEEAEEALYDTVLDWYKEARDIYIADTRLGY